MTLAHFADAGSTEAAARLAACVVNVDLCTLLPDSPAAVALVLLLSSGAELERARTAFFARRETHDAPAALVRQAAAAAAAEAANDDDGIAVSFFANAAQAAEADEDASSPDVAPVVPEDDALAFLGRKIGEHGQVRLFVCVPFWRFVSC